MGFESAEYSVEENRGFANLTITRSGTSAMSTVLTVVLATSDGSATGNIMLTRLLAFVVNNMAILLFSA